MGELPFNLSNLLTFHPSPHCEYAKTSINVMVGQEEFFVNLYDITSPGYSDVSIQAVIQLIADLRV